LPQPIEAEGQHKIKGKRLKINKLKVPFKKDSGAKTFRSRLKLQK